MSIEGEQPRSDQTLLSTGLAQQQQPQSQQQEEEQGDEEDQALEIVAEEYSSHASNVGSQGVPWARSSCKGGMQHTHTGPASSSRPLTL